MTDLDQLQAQLNRVEEKVDRIIEKIGSYVTYPWFIGALITLSAGVAGLIVAL